MGLGLGSALALGLGLAKPKPKPKPSASYHDDAAVSPAGSYPLRAQLLVVVAPSTNTHFGWKQGLWGSLVLNSRVMHEPSS